MSKPSSTVLQNGCGCDRVENLLKYKSGLWNLLQNLNIFLLFRLFDLSRHKALNLLYEATFFNCDL